MSPRSFTNTVGLFYPNTGLPTRPTNVYSQPTAWQTRALFQTPLPAEEREVLTSGKLCCNGRRLLGTVSKSPVVCKQHPIGHVLCYERREDGIKTTETTAHLAQKIKPQRAQM